MSNLSILPSPNQSLIQHVEQAATYAENSKAKNTRRAYRADWRTFADWCATQGIQSLPCSGPGLAAYIAARAQSGAKVASIERALTTISQAHKAAGFNSPRGSPEVRAVFQGIRRVHNTVPLRKSPVLIHDLRLMVADLSESRIDVRNRALLLLGFAGGFRRSELVGLDVADIARDKDGLRVNLRRSKTDQEGVGRMVGIPYGSVPQTCPVRAVCSYLEIIAGSAGALFEGISRHGRPTGKRLHGEDVARIVKARCLVAGLDPSLYSGHSLRAGLVTAAARAGKSDRDIMAQTGHTSSEMVRRYIRDAQLFENNAASGIGL